VITVLNLMIAASPMPGQPITHILLMFSPEHDMFYLFSFTCQN
jgi:hypothetical protein